MCVSGRHSVGLCFILHGKVEVRDEDESGVVLETLVEGNYFGSKSSFFYTFELIVYYIDHEPTNVFSVQLYSLIDVQLFSKWKLKGNS